ncbi:hypothetical protein [Paraburkholderia atlantica]|uniref:hypothetical protein n=1 Tax=Paraburkholderia atlantica TaxID=2654982 RepID=UPI003D256AC3
MARGDFIDAVRAIALSRADEFSNIRLAASHSLSTRSDAAAFFRSAKMVTGDGSFVDEDGNPVTVDDPGVISLVSKRSLISLVGAAVPNGWRHVQPFQSIARQTLGTSAAWAAEAAIKIVGDPPLFVIDRALVRKITGTTIAADELLRRANAAINAALTRGLVDAVTDELNQTFASNDAPSANSPGGVLYGISPIPSAGSLDADVAALVAAFPGDLARACWIMSPRMAVGLVKEFTIESTLGVGGGFLVGLPAVAAAGVSDNVLALVDCSRVAMFDGPLVPAVAGQATLAVIDESGATPVTSVMSLWQQNLVAMRAEKYCWWSAGEDAAVWINDAEPLSVTHATPTAPALLQKQTKTKGATA